MSNAKSRRRKGKKIMRCANDFHVGQIVISEFDAPCCRMLGVVESILKTPTFERIICRYLSRHIGKDQELYGPPEHMTPVEEFGVTVCFDDESETMTTTQDKSKCVATYKDGKPRRWQPRGCEVAQFRKHYRRLVQLSSETRQRRDLPR
jgi:hypothetical protein